MADRLGGLAIDVSGDLDTASPIGNRPPGALVETLDAATSHWGPRRGSQAFTRAWEGPGTASLYDAITLNGTNSARAIAQNYEEQFRDLGTKFTLDLWFRLEDLAYAAGFDAIGLYNFIVGGLGEFHVSIYGPNHADHEKIRVEIVTNPTRGTTAALVGFTGTTRITAGTTQADKQHVRVVRDGATVSLFANGVADGSTSSLSATNPLATGAGTSAAVTLGDSTIFGFISITFKGHIYGAVLRDGAFTSLPIESVMPCFPWAGNVHHYYLGRSIALGGDDHYFDAGRFGAHARVIFNVGGDYTVTASNDDTAPAPVPCQGLRTWTTRTNRTATSVLTGGVLSTAIVS